MKGSEQATVAAPVQAFCQQLLVHLHDIGDHYRLSDPAGMRRATNHLRALRGNTTTEDHRSSYETHFALAVLWWAQLAADELHCERVVKLCGAVLQIMAAKVKRRVGAGLEVRPDSEVWYRLIGTLADAKWKGGSQLRGAVLSVGNMLSRYYEVAERVRLYLRGDCSPAADNEEVHEALAQTACMLAKLLVRYRSCELQALIVFVADNFSDQLRRRDHPYYWDLQIGLRSVSQRRDRSDLRELFAKRYAALRQLRGKDAVLTQYVRAIINEQKLLLPREHLELVAERKDA